MSDFWARRKASVAKEAEAELAAVQAADEAKVEAELAERTDEELLAEAKQPAPEDLDSAEAVREFMSSALPQRLKTRALRQLWKLNPVLANLDGLVDYGEDFTDSATVIENLQTAYQVGKGMLKHVEEMAKANEPQPETEPEDTDRDDLIAEASDPDEDEIDVVMPEPEPVLAASEPQLNDYSDELPAPTRARRMQFRFEERV